MKAALKIDKQFYEILYRHLNVKQYLSPDPLVMALQFSSSADREVAAFISALFALGRVESILAYLSDLFSVLDSPAQQLRSLSAADIAELCENRTYRFFSPRRTAVLLATLGSILTTYGSLEGAGAAARNEQMPALAVIAEIRKNFVKAAIEIAPRFEHLAEHPSGLLAGNNSASPGSRELPGIIFPELKQPFTKGGAAKRLMLFLRWMVRQDEIDPGGWEILAPSDLVYPLDTHLMRLGGELGLRSRNSADLRTALEITANMKRINPLDPVKYDFCLTRMGIHPDLQKEDILSKFYSDPDGFERYLGLLEARNENTQKS